MVGKPSPETVSTKIERIAELAKRMPSVALTSLSHHVDIEWMHEAYRRTRKDGAPGVDQMTAEELWHATMDARGGWVYEADIEDFFGSVDHTKLREVLSQRVRDGVLTRLMARGWRNGRRVRLPPTDRNAARRSHDAPHAIANFEWRSTVSRDRLRARTPDGRMRNG